MNYKLECFRIANSQQMSIEEKDGGVVLFDQTSLPKSFLKFETMYQYLQCFDDVQPESKSEELNQTKKQTPFLLLQNGMRFLQNQV